MNTFKLWHFVNTPSPKFGESTAVSIIGAIRCHRYAAQKGKFHGNSFFVTFSQHASSRLRPTRTTSRLLPRNEDVGDFPVQLATIGRPAVCCGIVLCCMPTV